MEKQVAYMPLARRWRSKTFDEIIGQDLAVKILKNSLYKQSIFPVYLFAGQRGCGKTSMARIFAAGLECERLAEFAANPSLTVPCACCDACRSVRAGTHPDVIEIDAASHTGVEHVRQLIETTSFLPTSGMWKVYVVDEAHMLSKAAFNALLKILEEPPRTVVFILATTDPQKIIETVRSRALHILFEPLAQDVLCAHLERICTHEGFAYDHQALQLIARSSGGSARDAIVLLERIVLSEGSVEYSFVKQLLGRADRVIGEQLWQHLNTIDWASVQLELDQIRHARIDCEAVWSQLVEVGYELYRAQDGNRHTILAALDVLFSYESLWAKTVHKHVLLQLVLARMIACFDGSESSKKNIVSVGSEPVVQSTKKTEQKISSLSEVKAVPVVPQTVACVTSSVTTASVVTASVATASADEGNPWWHAFISAVGAQGDVSLQAFFRHVIQALYDKPTNTVVLQFAQNDLLCKEFVESALTRWKPLLCQELSIDLEKLNLRFELVEGGSNSVAVGAPIATGFGQQAQKKVDDSGTERAASFVAPVRQNQKTFQSGYRTDGSKVYKKSTDASHQLAQKTGIKVDAAQWPTAALVVEVFGGTLMVREE